jgi:hypothetical protein
VARWGVTRARAIYMGYYKTSKGLHVAKCHTYAVAVMPSASF